MSMVDNPRPAWPAEAMWPMRCSTAATPAFPRTKRATEFSFLRSRGGDVRNYFGRRDLAAQDYAQKSLAQFSEESARVPTSEVIALRWPPLATSIKARCLACLTRSGRKRPYCALANTLIPDSHLCLLPKTKRFAVNSLSWGISVISWKEVKPQDYIRFGKTS